MIALIRYHLAVLLRSHRWIPPTILYVLGVVALAASNPPYGAGLAPGLSWAALMLVPVVAWLTRATLTAEPPAARACVAAAAGGPRRTQIAALIAPALLGAVVGLFGVGWELFRTGLLRTDPGGVARVGATVKVLGGGLLAALICLLVASAIGALCNPPVVRRPGPGMLTTTVAVVVAIAWNISPANAALRTPDTGVPTTAWPSGVPVIAALALAVIAWAISVALAARRGG